MEEKTFQDGINFLANLLQKQHNEQFNWAKSIYDNQQNLKKSIGITDDSMPWEPYYNRSVPMNSKEPEIYNKYGEKLKVVFHSDKENAHGVYSVSRYVFFDRYNYALKTHVYSHEEAFRLVGNPDKRFAYLCESRAIVPQSYMNYLKNKEYFKNNFNFIFSYDEEVLNNIGNARFAPFCARVWYGRLGGGYPSEENYKNKTKDISILSSDKEMCKMHIIRKHLALKCKKENLADTYGTFDGGPHVPIDDSLKDYRYSIVVENDLTPFFFTEKITSCFAAQTIPIYLGATEIDKFFNPDGIIKFKLEDIDHIEDILKQCTQEEYERRLPAIIDNYHRTMNDYFDRDCWDVICNQYF